MDDWKSAYDLKGRGRLVPPTVTDKDANDIEALTQDIRGTHRLPDARANPEARKQAQGKRLQHEPGTARLVAKVLLGHPDAYPDAAKDGAMLLAGCDQHEVAQRRNNAVVQLGDDAHFDLEVRGAGLADDTAVLISKISTMALTAREAGRVEPKLFAADLAIKAVVAAQTTRSESAAARTQRARDQGESNGAATLEELSLQVQQQTRLVEVLQAENRKLQEQLLANRGASSAVAPEGRKTTRR